MPTKKGPDIISVETINEFVKWVTQQAQAKQMREKLRKRLLKRLDAGAVCSTAGPFLLEVIPYDRTEIDWKAETQSLLKSMYGKRWKAHFDRIVNAAPQKPVKRLEPKPNPAYTDNLVET